MKEQFKQFGERVREAREAQGWTQSELAERLGLNRNSLAMIERGEVGTTLERVYDFAKATGQSASFFFSETAKPIVYPAPQEHRPPSPEEALHILADALRSKLPKSDEMTETLLRIWRVVPVSDRARLLHDLKLTYAALDVEIPNRSVNPSKRRKL